MQLRNLKRTFTAALAAVVLMNAPMQVVHADDFGKAVTTQTTNTTPLWSDFRGNTFNNAVVNSKTPTSYENASLSWASLMGTGSWDCAVSNPTLVGDSLFITAGKEIYKVNRFTGETEKKATLAANTWYVANNIVYADGKLFVPLTEGTIQAFDADTLESLWIYYDEIGGQPNAAMKYDNGYLYTGFYVADTQNANFVCINVKDEDPNNKKEEKMADWVYPHMGGFYFAGACVTEHYVVVGGAKGTLLTFDPKTGAVITKKTGLNGDIRSSICFDQQTGRYYFTSNNGSFYSVSIGTDGTIGNDIKELSLSGASTSTPVVYNGRAYVGVAGTNAFGKYTGHNITVIDLDNFAIAYSAKTRGYVQSSGLLSTANEAQEGSVSVYFTENTDPGIVRVIKDQKGQTASASGEYADILFTPQGKQANYCLASLISDEYGTMYMKNDSGYLMAVGSKVTSIEVETAPAKTEYKNGENFDHSGIEVAANLANGLKRDITNEVTFDTEKLTMTGTAASETKAISISYANQLYQDAADNSKADNHLSEVLSPVTTTCNVTVLNSPAVPSPEVTASPVVTPTPEVTASPVVTPKPLTITDKINKLPTKITTSNVNEVIKAIDEISVEYNKLSSAEQKKVDPNNRVTTAKSQIVKVLLRTNADKTVQKGNSISLLSKNNFSFAKDIRITSSNSKVVSIANTLTAKAVGEGTATITVTLNKTITVAKFKVTVPVTAPSAVKLNKAAGVNAISIKISYGKVSNADGYIIYRADKKNGTYKQIKQVTNNNTTAYTDKCKIQTGKTYYYKVVSYKKSGSKLVKAKASNIKSAKTTLKATKITKTKAVSKTKATITWNRNKEANGYVVYQATKKNGSYKKIRTVNSNKTTAYTAGGLKKNKTYYYKVRAYRTVNGKKVYSGYSNIKSVKTKK